MCLGFMAQDLGVHEFILQLYLQGFLELRFQRVPDLTSHMVSEHVKEVRRVNLQHTLPVQNVLCHACRSPKPSKL